MLPGDGSTFRASVRRGAEVVATGATLARECPVSAAKERDEPPGGEDSAHGDQKPERDGELPVDRAPRGPTVVAVVRKPAGRCLEWIGDRVGGNDSHDRATRIPGSDCTHWRKRTPRRTATRRCGWNSVTPRQPSSSPTLQILDLQVIAETQAAAAVTHRITDTPRRAQSGSA